MLYSVEEYKMFSTWNVLLPMGEKIKIMIFWTMIPLVLNQTATNSDTCSKLKLESP